MPKDYYQVKGDDGCVYIYDYSTEKWSRLCDIDQTTDLPPDVRKKVIDGQAQARGLLKIKV
jgi:hypothetical protein